MSSSRVQGRISQIKRNRIYSYRKAVGGVNGNVNGREDLGWKYWDEQVNKDL